MNINVDAIFSKLRQSNYKQKKKECVKKVVQATSFTSENVHGGYEATNDIENSTSNADNGKQEKKTSKSTGLQNKNTKKEKKTKSKNTKIEKDHDHSHRNQKGNNKDIKKELDSMFENKKINFNSGNLSEIEMTYKIFQVIKQCLKKVNSFETKDGFDSYDSNKISKDILLRRKYRIPIDKYEYSEPKKALFFLDTSGSIQSIRPYIRSAFKLLIKSGYKIEVAGCGNGFWFKDAKDDEYHVKNYLKKIEKTTLASIVRPCVETAAKMANKADISFIIADFDGLSDIVKMAQMCSKEKIPFLLCS